MTRFQLLCFLIIVSFATTQANNFSRITFSNGKTVVPKGRMLEGIPNTTLPHAINTHFYDFVVEAEWFGNYTEVNGLNYSPEMVILLYTSQSAVGAPNSTCANLRDPVYNCTSDIHCTESTNPVNLTLPFLNSTNATSVSLTDSPIVSLANNSWQTSSLFYIHNCDKSNAVLGDYLYDSDGDGIGWIGLGTSSGGNENFANPSNPLFSILLNVDGFSDSGYGEILFGFEPSYVNTSASPFTIVTNEDWQTNVSSISWEFFNWTSNTSHVWNETFSTPTTLIFDLAYDNIALPVDQYRSIMTYIYNLAATAKAAGAAYNSDNEDSDLNNYWECLSSDASDGDFTSCAYQGNISTLQNFNIALGNGTILSLPPSAFLDSSLETLFDGFNSSYSNTNYTVLGRYILNNYYTVFNQTDSVNYITLYPRLTDLFTNPPVENSGSPSNTTTPTTHTTQPTPVISGAGVQSTDSHDKTVIRVVIGVILAVVVIAGVMFIGFKKGWWLQPKINTEESTLGIELRSQEVMVNNPVVDNPAPVAVI